MASEFPYSINYEVASGFLKLIDIEKISSEVSSKRYASSYGAPERTTILMVEPRSVVATGD
jgi:hypothetical protein